MFAIPPEFFQALRDIYSDKKAWDQEEVGLRQAMELIVADLPNVYELREPKGVGGSGVVIKLWDKNLKRLRALKVSRPSLGKEIVLADLLEAESLTLARLSHQNLIHIFARGQVDARGRKCPYYVMEYIDDVLDADKYLQQPDRTRSEFFRLLGDVISGVSYLHQNGIVHMDLKPGNIFVAPDGSSIVADFGFAKWLKQEGGDTIIGGTEGYMHPEARRFVQEVATDPNRLKGRAPRTWLKTTWDLYALGQTLLNLLKVVAEHHPKMLDTYDRRYLRLMACRMLDGHNGEDEKAVNLEIEAIREIKYAGIAEVSIDYDKLSGVYDLPSRVEELSLHYPDTIQASTLATTPFTRRVRRLVETPAVQRLGTFTQLGLLNLIYPTANHNRLEHSLGAFSVMCRMMSALFDDALNPVFRQVMNEEDLKAGLLAALLHDIGQFPLGHDIEEGDPTFEHEQMGFELLRNDPGVREALRLWGVSAERVVAILSKPTGQTPLKDRILHSLIDGPIDADKIDYLIRDCVHLGLPYARAIDLERLLRTLTIVTDGTNAALGMHEKGKIPAETVAFVRYAMFGQVYWHHAYRAMKAMMHRMFWEALANAKERGGERALRNELERFVMPNSGVSQAELTLFPNVRSASIGPIHRTDLTVLQWVADRAGKAGRSLFEGIKARQFFKRALVLSRDHSNDAEVCKELHEFYATYRLDWYRKRQLQIEFQASVSKKVKAKRIISETAILTADLRNAFLTDCSDRPILLIDVPPERRASTAPLRYMVERDRELYKSDEIKLGSFDASAVWKSLQTDSYRSLGKVRVFCDDKYKKFLLAFLGSGVLTEILRTAIREVRR